MIQHTFGLIVVFLEELLALAIVCLLVNLRLKMQTEIVLITMITNILGVNISLVWQVLKFTTFPVAVWPQNGI